MIDKMTEGEESKSMDEITPLPKNPAEAATRMDFTFLRHDASPDAFLQFLQDSLSYPFACLIVPPALLNSARSFYQQQGVSTPLGSVVGFPLGFTPTEIKREEARFLLHNGASEIDMVGNLFWLKSDLPRWQKEVQEVASLVHSYKAIFKIILETSLLTPNEMAYASESAVSAGVDFIKTSTGYFGGAAPEAVRLIRQTVGYRAKIKASGGIRTRQHFLKMLQAGADRIGTSHAIPILQEFEDLGKGNPGKME